MENFKKATSNEKWNLKYSLKCSMNNLRQGKLRKIRQRFARLDEKLRNMLTFKENFDIFYKIFMENLLFHMFWPIFWIYTISPKEYAHGR